jgi:hypothetical protein
MSWGSQIRVESTRVPGFASEPRRDFREDYEISRIFFVSQLHAPFEYTSDITTTPHPDPKFASVATGIPPVPGSPTGAGADGTQPLNDSQARTSPGSEKGWPTAPREQPQARFIRQ